MHVNIYGHTNPNQRTNGPVNAHLISGQNLTLALKGQGQPLGHQLKKIMMVPPESPMLHTIFRGFCRPLVPEKKVFDGFLSYTGIEAILVM